MSEHYLEEGLNLLAPKCQLPWMCLSFWSCGGVLGWEPPGHILFFQWDLSSNMDLTLDKSKGMVCLIWSQLSFCCLTYFDIHGLSLTNGISDQKTLHTCTTSKMIFFAVSSWSAWFCGWGNCWKDLINLDYFPVELFLACLNGRRTWHRPTTQHIQSCLRTPRDPTGRAEASHWGVGCLGYHVEPADTYC